MKKTFVIDTSVLLYHEDSVHAFPGCNLIIPMVVLEELDKFKIRRDSVGNASRYVNRFLDGLRAKGSFSTGIELENGQRIYVVPDCEVPDGLDRTKNDNMILSTAIHANTSLEDFGEVILLTKDISLRIKADAFGVNAENYFKEKAKVSRRNAYTGVSVVQGMEDFDIDDFYKEGEIDLDEEFYENEFVVMKGPNRKSAIGRYVEGTVRKLSFVPSDGVGGVKPRNKEQNFSLEVLMDPSISMVTITGKAGSGKTLMSVVASMTQLMDGSYKKLIVTRPNISMSKDIGFLPGPQPLTAKILTPEGWTTMGDIKAGDFVISRDGQPARVLKIFPKGKKEVYRVETSSGLSSESCIDHIWATKDYEEKKRGKAYSLRSLKEIKETLTVHKKDKDVLNHYLPRNEAVMFTEKEISIPAYSMGYILGDGSISNSISITTKDLEVIDRVRKEMNDINCDITSKSNIQYFISDTEKLSNKVGKIICIKDMKSKETLKFSSRKAASKALGINETTLGSRCKNRSTIDGKKYYFEPDKSIFSNKLKQYFYSYGLMNKKSFEKFIPDEYKYNSIDVRLNVLRGLMDSDGTVKKNGEASFTTTSKFLAEDLIEIVRSLGGRANLIKRDRVGRRSKFGSREIISKRVSYEFSVSLPEKYNPFFLPRKKNMYSKKYIHDERIKSIESLGEKEVQCIMIDHPEHLYVTDDFLVTHNTKEEKMGSWVQPIFDNIKIAFSKNAVSYIEAMMDKGEIEIESLSYIRGRSLPDTIFIVDEAQNITYHEAKAVLTRMGENSKIILLGDIEQIDAPHLDATSSGLSSIVELFKEFDESAHITLLKGERSRLATYAAKIL